MYKCPTTDPIMAMGFVDKLVLNHLGSIWCHSEPFDVPYSTYWNKVEIVFWPNFKTFKERLFWIWNKIYFEKEKKIMQSAFLKFIYSERATKFCEIFTFLLFYVVPVKSKVKISQNVVAFSDYMNFNLL